MPRQKNCCKIRELSHSSPIEITNRGRLVAIISRPQQIPVTIKNISGEVLIKRLTENRKKFLEENTELLLPKRKKDTLKNPFKKEE